MAVFRQQKLPIDTPRWKRIFNLGGLQRVTERSLSGNWWL